MEERALDELSSMSTMHIMESENTFIREDDYPDLDFKVFDTATTTDIKQGTSHHCDGPEDSNIEIHEPGSAGVVDIDVDVDLNNPPGDEIGIEGSIGSGSGGGCVSFISLRLSKCLICFGNIIHSETGPEFQQTPLKLGSESITSTTTTNTRKDDDLLSLQLDEEIPQNILCGFSKLFKISSTIYRNIDLASLTNPLFCSSCNAKISESFSILRQIEKLEKDLDHLRRDIRDDLLKSYRSDPDGFQAFLQGGYQNGESQSVPVVSMSQSKNKDRIRKAYAQCWAKSTITIGACPTLSKGKATKKSSRNKRAVKKENVQAQVKNEVEKMEDFTVTAAAADSVYEPYPADYLNIVTGQDHKNSIEMDAFPSDGEDPDGGYEPVDMDDDPWVNNDEPGGELPDKSVDIDGDGDGDRSEPEIPVKTGSPFALHSFQCEYCKRNFNKEDYKTETGKYIFVCDLPNCKTIKPIASLGILRKHHIINCLKKPEYICKYCERRCFSAKNLRSHIVSRHSKAQAAELKNVEKNSKLKSEASPDSQIPNVTSTIASSRRTRRKPERSQLYVDWTQQQTDNDNDDETDNSTSPTSTNKNKLPKSEAAESESKLIRSGIGNPILSFACDYCKREFNLEDYKTESGDYRIHCDLPDCKTKKPFTSLSVLKKHHKINCLKKPEYICKFCERRCFSAKNLRSHIVSRHSKIRGGANKVSLSTKNKISRLLQRKRARSVSQSDTENEMDGDAGTEVEADADAEAETDAPNRIRKSRPKSNKLTDGVKIGAGIGNPIISFHCEFCKREFKLEDYLNEAGDYDINCDLPDCKTTKPFLSLGVLKKHHAINCLSKPEFVCEHCNRRCFSSRTLRQHIASRHPKNKVTGRVAPVRPNSFTCEYCSRVYSKEDYKTVVNGKTLIQIHCDLPNCKTTTPFTIFSAFKRHHRKNCLLRPRFPCDVCGNNLFSPKALEEHVISQHTKQYEFTCEICGYAGLNPTYLKRHMYYKHSDEKPHKCEICAEPFKDKRMLLCHVRRHKNEMPFVCEICGKGFPVVERFNKHKFVHETEKRFACPICGKLFRSPHYVDTHIWNSHKKLRPKNKPSTKRAAAAGRGSRAGPEPGTEPGTGPGLGAQANLDPINEEESLEFVEMIEYDNENDN